MNGEKDTWNEDMQKMINEEMKKKVSKLNAYEINTVGALLALAKKNDVPVDILDLTALNEIAAETPLTYENLTKDQKKSINTVYDNLPPSPQWSMRKGGYKKTRKRRRKHRRKSRKKKKRKSRKKSRKRKRKKKTKKKRRYKHTGGNKCKCCKCCKKRKPKKKSRKRR